MGVWIETRHKCTKLQDLAVTPFVGVWIETVTASKVTFSSFVTPFVGVWIETPQSFLRTMPLKSHPSWVCGLKLSNQKQYADHY